MRHESLPAAQSVAKPFPHPLTSSFACGHTAGSGHTAVQFANRRAKISTLEKHCKKHQQDEEGPDARAGPATTQAKVLAEKIKQEQR